MSQERATKANKELEEMFANNDTIELTNHVQALLMDSRPDTIMNSTDHEDIKEDGLDPNNEPKKLTLAAKNKQGSQLNAKINLTLTDQNKEGGTMPFTQTNQSNLNSTNQNNSLLSQILKIAIEKKIGGTTQTPKEERLKPNKTTQNNNSKLTLKKENKKVEKPMALFSFLDQAAAEQGKSTTFTKTNHNHTNQGRGAQDHDPRSSQAQGRGTQN